MPPREGQTDVCIVPRDERGRWGDPRTGGALTEDLKAEETVDQLV